MRTLLLSALFCVGCVANSSTDEASATGNSDPAARASCTGDRDACKIEGSQIGREGVTVQLDQGTATFVDWIPKAGEPNEFVGFSLVLEGTSEVHYVVKAGTERFPSSEASWKHAGADCHGISNVDFGDTGTDGGTGTGGDGGGCDNPDGCPTDDGGDGPLL